MAVSLPNLKIRAALARPRPSLSPSRFSDEDFRKFKRADTHASKKKQVAKSVMPIIEGDAGDPKSVAGHVPFTNLDHLTDGCIGPGNPDIYYGARPEQLERQIREQLSGQVVPSTQHDLPVAPNFFIAINGPESSPAVALRQACYDGALGEKGMQSLCSYREPTSAPNDAAHTLTATYYAGTLKLYTTHSIQAHCPQHRTEYVMTQIDAMSLTGNAEGFRRGAGAFRNARDWAKQKRDEVIEQANRKAAQLAISMPPGVATTFATDASGDTECRSQETLTPRNPDSTISS